MKVCFYLSVLCAFFGDAQSRAEDLTLREQSLTFFGQVIELTPQVIVIQNGLGTRQLRRSGDLSGDLAMSPELRIGDHVMIIGGEPVEVKSEGISSVGASHQQAGEVPLTERDISISGAPLVVPVILDDRAFFPG